MLKKLLKYWHENGDKVLLFSHSVQLLRMLQHLFQSTSYNVSFLSGEMKYEDRQDTVDDFNSDPNQFIFLISTKAGGTFSSPSSLHSTSCLFCSQNITFKCSNAFEHCIWYSEDFWKRVITQSNKDSMINDHILLMAFPSVISQRLEVEYIQRAIKP